MATKPIPDIVFRLHSKRGRNDCAVAVLATYLRRDPEEVLIAASKVKNNVWSAGLHCPDIVRTAKKLGVNTRWTKTFDVEEETGVLWVSYRDVILEHIVFLHEGKIYDPDHNPISLWDHDDYFAHYNAYGNALLKIED